MMLSSFPMNSKDQDVGRQMAAIRSYLATLKDELENDLNNIGYRNLDADLRGRFDDLTDSFFALQRQTDNVAEIVKAKYITADEIVAKYATISSLNAATARIGSLEADHVSTGSFNAVVADVVNIKANYITASAVAATYATITNLNSVNAKFNNLDASKITSGTLNADRVDFSTGITTNMAVESTILIGFKRYKAGTSDYYLSIDRNGITFHKRNSPMLLLDYTKMASL